MLKDRVALITGASRGIGAATAKLFAKNHAAVAVNYFQSDDLAEEIVQEIEKEGGRAIAVSADVRNDAQVQTMVEKISSTLGPIDILVSNAAIMFPLKPFMEYSWAEFEAKLVGEMKSVFNCCKAVLPSMIERHSGAIIAISSCLSRQPQHSFCVHSTAKSGLDAFVRSLALEVGPLGVRVNTVAPGLTYTDATAWLADEVKEQSAKQTPLGRNADPEDIAGAILAVASDHMRFTSGSYIPVSGGMLMP